jgi:predicted enzyme related to lactoylglutathione lyase
MRARRQSCQAPAVCRFHGEATFWFRRFGVIRRLLRIAQRAGASAGHTPSMPAPLIEFPADDPDRARRFWHGVLGVTLAPRPAAAGSGWQTDTDGLRLGVHERGPGPGDTASLPYFTVADLATTLERVRELGGSIIHPGDRWAVCRDSEGSPFALAAAPTSG